MTITPDMLVQREVRHCVSALVSTLAKGADGSISYAGERHQNPRMSPIADIMSLADQAAELSYPVPDYEGAATEHGAKISKNDDGKFIVLDQPQDSPLWCSFYDDTESAAQEYCGFHDIEPHDREVYEHWIVSDWLADQLEAKGEKVDRDFSGLIIWARTTTGQAISLDWVIEQITAELNARNAA